MIINFGFCGIKFGKNSLFGIRDDKYTYIWTFQFLFITVVYLNKASESMLIKTMAMLKRDDKYWVENNHVVRAALAQKKIEVEQEFKDEYESELEYANKEIDRLREQLTETRGINRTLEAALKAVRLLPHEENNDE